MAKQPNRWKIVSFLPGKCMKVFNTILIHIPVVTLLLIYEGMKFLKGLAFTSLLQNVNPSRKPLILHSIVKITKYAHSENQWI